MKISEIKINPENPRKIDKLKLEQLKDSIKNFPKMMELRPIIIDSNNVILGGNQRYTALKSLGYTEIPNEWVKRADDLTSDEKRRFIITDNNNFGDWDYKLLNDWDSGELAEWGLELEGWEDYSEKNKEIQTDSFEDEMQIILKFDSETYWKIQDKLQGKTAEQILLKALELA